MADIFDRHALLDRLDGDAELFEEIIRDYVRDVPKQLGLLTAALESGESELVARQAHTIKGASGNVGALALQEAALGVEMAGKRGDLAHAAELTDKLMREFERLEEIMREEVNPAG